MIGDGASWIWNLAAIHFPSTIEIVDLYHAREHLSEQALSILRAVFICLRVTAEGHWCPGSQGCNLSAPMEMVRYCPACEDEFRPDIAVCSDCGASLILQEEGLGARGVPTTDGGKLGVPHWREALDALPVSTLVPLRTFDSLRDLEPVLAAFADRELPSRVLVQNGRYILLVAPSTIADAQAALQLAEGTLPDEPDPTFDATTGRYANCPACDTPLSGESNNCPECGLELRASGGSTPVPEAE